MKLVTAILFSLLLCGLSLTPVSAESPDPSFSYRMTGTVTTIDGEENEVDMLIGFQESSRGWYFRAGSDHVFMDKPPSAYNLIINLDGHGRAFVSDFSQKPVTHFLINIDDYEIELFQASGIAFGMRLRINDRQFLFDSAHPRIRFELSEDGLGHVIAESTLRDLSIRRAN